MGSVESTNYEKVDKIILKIEHDQHVISHDIVKKLNNHCQASVNILKKTGSEKQLDV